MRVIKSSRYISLLNPCEIWGWIQPGFLLDGSFLPSCSLVHLCLSCISLHALYIYYVLKCLIRLICWDSYNNFITFTEIQPYVKSAETPVKSKILNTLSHIHEEDPCYDVNLKSRRWEGSGQDIPMWSCLKT